MTPIALRYDDSLGSNEEMDLLAAPDADALAWEKRGAIRTNPGPRGN